MFFDLNPLFEREWRERWRRPWSFIIVGGFVLGVAALLLVLAWRLPLDGVTVQQLRERGTLVLAFYRGMGGALLGVVSLLIGIASIEREREAGTFDALLLASLGPRGVVSGKWASGAAFLLVLQIALWPLLIWSGVWLLQRDGEVILVVASHLVLMAQGLSLGVLAGVRTQSGQSALLEAGRIWLQLLTSLFSIVFMVGVFLYGVYMVLLLVGALASLFIPGLLISFKTVTSILTGLALQTAIWAGQAVLNVLGVGALWSLPPVFVPFQIVGAALWLKWTIWQIDAPERNLQLIDPQLMAVAASPSATPPALETPLRKALNTLLEKGSWRETQQELLTLLKKEPQSLFALLWLRWSWTLSDAQKAGFSLLSDATQQASSWKTSEPSGVVPRGAAPLPATRLRLLQTRWLHTLNPVFWLDLQRCLSLRSPTGMAALWLWMFAGIGGSIFFSVTLAILVSVVQSAFTHSRANVELDSFVDVLHLLLFYGALVVGPLFSARGFVVERRAKILDELRLTLLSARDVLWGKVVSRLLIPLVGGLPLALLLGFFLFHRVETSSWLDVARGSLLFVAVGACCVLVPLILSFHAPTPLAASLWSLGFAATLGFGWRVSAASDDWAWLSPLQAQLEPMLWPRTFFVYSLTVFLSALYLFARLRRAGFG